MASVEINVSSLPLSEWMLLKEYLKELWAKSKPRAFLFLSYDFVLWKITEL